MKQKKRASKGKSKSSTSPKKPAKKAAAGSSGKAKKASGKKPGGKPSKKKTSGARRSKPAGPSMTFGSSKITSRPKGLKAGSDSRAEQLRTMLETKRSEILEEIRRARQDSVESDRTSFAEVGDLVSASLEKERAFEYGEIGVNALREIDNALGKLKEGTYGICEVCSKPIGLRRLKVMPSARLCIDCKSKEEASGR